jgi:hypothetical protein
LCALCHRDGFARRSSIAMESLAHRCDTSELISFSLKALFCMGKGLKTLVIDLSHKPRFCPSKIRLSVKS